MHDLLQQLGGGRLGYHSISGDPTGMLWEKKYQVCVCLMLLGQQGSYTPVTTQCTQQFHVRQRKRACVPPQAMLAKGSILPVMRATEQHNKPFLTKVRRGCLSLLGGLWPRPENQQPAPGLLPAGGSPVGGANLRMWLLCCACTHTQVLSDTAAACQGADLILSGPLSLTATMCVAEQLRVPWVPVVLGPVMPTAEFPSWAISSSPFPFKWLNRASYSFIFWALFKQESGRINRWRMDSLGLPPLQQGSAGVLAACPTIPVITTCTGHVIPGLRAPQDWGSNVHLTGFAFPAATPPDAVDPDLRAFLQPDEAAAGGDAAGSTAGSRGKPLYLGFGSMPAPDPKALLQLAVQVVQQTGKRAVLVAGWSELGGLIGSGEGQVQLPQGLLVVPSAPHDFLLPR